MRSMFLFLNSAHPNGFSVGFEFLWKPQLQSVHWDRWLPHLHLPPTHLQPLLQHRRYPDLAAKVPVQFEVPVYRLGFLNPSSNEEDLQAGLKLELPFWLAKVLGKRNIVSVQLPKQYRRGQREILRADAKVVDLYKQGPYFYGLGMQLLSFNHLESRDLSKNLLEAFLNRFRLIMDNSQNADEADLYSLNCRLDEVERVLFQLGHQSAQQMDLWEKGSSCKITSSLVVQANRKRKRRPSQ